MAIRLLRRKPGTSKDLSVVIVFYNMRREAHRTLHSLSRAYQQGLEDLDYEVIVVENGSADDQRLGEEFVRSFGPEFQYLDLGTEATPTPAVALNRGLAVASGESIAFMIDGAHVLTPGVLRHGMSGLTTYAPAVVATQQWYVGPGQQGDQQETGYDQAYEDRLFDQIEWPGDGYRLFDIGHFIGDRDWLDGLWESNCMFVPRKLLEQVGGYDESFAMAGGGYANLDFYERMGSTPGVNVVTILGEGSFHQLHGGTTTNQLDSDGRRQRIVSYADHYAELRGRPFHGPGKTIHYVGTMFHGALRTRARRMTPVAFREARTTTGPDGRPTEPSPIPDELTADFTDGFWHSLAWRDTTWLGRRVHKAPTDLVVYQELVHRLRPTGSSRPAPPGVAARCSSVRSASCRPRPGAVHRQPSRRRPPSSSPHHVYRGPCPRCGHRASRERDRRCRIPTRSSCWGRRGSVLAYDRRVPCVLRARAGWLVRDRGGDDRERSPRVARVRARVRSKRRSAFSLRTETSQLTRRWRSTR